MPTLALVVVGQLPRLVLEMTRCVGRAASFMETAVLTPARTRAAEA